MPAGCPGVRATTTGKSDDGDRGCPSSRNIGGRSPLPLSSQPCGHVGPNLVRPCIGLPRKYNLNCRVCQVWNGDLATTRKCLPRFLPPVAWRIAMAAHVSRRDFVKTGAVAAAGLATAVHPTYT
ncbi:MAG TPA: twin-arginine translocation signal domain-containing protein, partial [Planctomycetaceae bacterium]|nr:twin-arginine translocation signal domain-containing protein [Planctomycetaceae bacterium]